MDKRVAYEPTGVRRYKQIVCTKTRAALAVACTAAFVLLIAFIAAFAQPGKDCSDALRQPSPSNASPLETTTSVDADFPWKSIRLPRTVLPESYDIFMHPNLTTFKFSGSVDIVVRVTEETNFIVLHTKQLNISKPTVQIADTHSFVSVVESKQSVKQEQYYLRMEQPLAVGNYLLRFLFDGVLSDLLTGFYRSSYKTSQGETRYVTNSYFSTYNLNDLLRFTLLFPVYICRVCNYPVLGYGTKICVNYALNYDDRRIELVSSFNIHLVL